MTKFLLGSDMAAEACGGWLLPTTHGSWAPGRSRRSRDGRSAGYLRIRPRRHRRGWPTRRSGGSDPGLHGDRTLDPSPTSAGPSTPPARGHCPVAIWWSGRSSARRQPAAGTVRAGPQDHRPRWPWRAGQRTGNGLATRCRRRRRAGGGPTDVGVEGRDRRPVHADVDPFTATAPFRRAPPDPLVRLCSMVQAGLDERSQRRRRPPERSTLQNAAGLGASPPLEPSAGWDDLCCPGRPAAARRVVPGRDGSRACSTTGAAPDRPSRRGISALFAGRRQGKTTRREAWDEPRLRPLHRRRATVAQVHRRDREDLGIFDQARRSTATLLRRADALFGKRSDGGARDARQRRARSPTCSSAWRPSTASHMAQTSGPTSTRVTRSLDASSTSPCPTSTRLALAAVSSAPAGRSSRTRPRAAPVLRAVGRRHPKHRAGGASWRGAKAGAP